MRVMLLNRQKSKNNGGSALQSGISPLPWIFGLGWALFDPTLDFGKLLILVLALDGFFHLFDEVWDKVSTWWSKNKGSSVAVSFAVFFPCEFDFASFINDFGFYLTLVVMMISVCTGVGLVSLFFCWIFFSDCFVNFLTSFGCLAALKPDVINSLKSNNFDFVLPILEFVYSSDYLKFGWPLILYFFLLGLFYLVSGYEGVLKFSNWVLNKGEKPVFKTNLEKAAYFPLQAWIIVLYLMMNFNQPFGLSTMWLASVIYYGMVTFGNRVLSGFIQLFK
jgi:hypothetical protein